MVRNIISNLDVETLLDKTVESVEEALGKFGAPHVDPVFVEEHVYRIDGSDPVQYRDKLRYSIQYEHAVKISERASISTVTVVIGAAGNGTPTACLNAIMLDEHGTKDRLSILPLTSTEDFAKAVEETRIK